MPTNYLIATLFFILTLVFLFMGYRRHTRAYLPFCLGFMLTAVINFIVGYSVS